MPCEACRIYFSNYNSYATHICMPSVGIGENAVGRNIPAEAKHADEGKVGLQYILAMPGLCDVARVGDYGAKKYGDQFNYKKGMPWMKLLGSCARHLSSFIRGEDMDPESKLPHLAHLVYDALMLLDYATLHKELDDRHRG